MSFFPSVFKRTISLCAVDYAYMSTRTVKSYREQRSGSLATEAAVRHNNFKLDSFVSRKCEVIKPQRPSTRLNSII